MTIPLRTRTPHLPDAPADLTGWWLPIDKDGEPSARRVSPTALAAGGIEIPDDVLRADGSVLMTGPLTTVAATADNHAVIKSQLDTVAGTATAAGNTATTAQATADAAMPKAGGTFTGQVVVPTPSGTTNPAQKGQLDTVSAAAAAAQSTATSAQGAAVAAQATADAAMPKAGGTFTGQVVVPAPAGATNPAQKSQVDSAVTAAAAAQTTADAALPKAGGTMTGPIVLAAAASAAGHPVRKAEFDLLPWALRAWLPPATLPAARLYGNGGSTPVEQYPLWQFQQSVVGYLDCYGLVPSSYPGSGAVLSLWFFGAIGTAGNMLISAAGRRLAGGAIGTSFSYSFATNVNLACPTLDVPVNISITLTHAQLGSPAAGDPILLRIRRDGATDAIAQHANFMAWAAKVVNA